MDKPLAPMDKCVRATVGAPLRADQAARAGKARAAAAGLAMALLGPAALAEGVDDLQPGLAAQVRKLAVDGARRAAGDASRIEVSLGPLDARMRLAPCQRVEPYLPNGVVLWGKARVGLRCMQGPSAWNVYLPITVSVFGAAWVAAAPLAAGVVVGTADLIQAEVNLAEEPAMAVTDLAQALGRTLSRALNAGQALRQTGLKSRQWFAAGDEVKVSASGSGFQVAGTAQALGAGTEGQPVKVRTESGRVLVGMPVGERMVELPL
jgi:flagella basal body P-ring formation protein FlgA